MLPGLYLEVRRKIWKKHLVDGDGTPKGWSIYEESHEMEVMVGRAPAGRWRYLATPVIGDPVVPGGHYNSLIITPRDNGLTKTSDFDPALHQAVINEPGSFSGAITLAARIRVAQFCLNTCFFGTRAQLSVAGRE